MAILLRAKLWGKSKVRNVPNTPPTLRSFGAPTEGGAKVQLRPTGSKWSSCSILPDQSESKSANESTGASVSRMRRIDDVLQKNLGGAIRAESAVITRFLCFLHLPEFCSKKFIKTACEIFHDAASFTRSGKNWFQNVGISLICTGFFVNATN
jgi:hypothetical protein